MFSHICVLAVDDDIIVSMFMNEVLATAGIGKIVLLDDGNKALSYLLEGNTVDLVITDWQMPVMDGVELTKKIRANPSLAKLPIVMISGESDPDIPLNAGVTEYMEKPVNPAKLLNAIYRILD